MTGNPSISLRKGYRLVPEDFDEETTTICLTSKDSYFVDLRIETAPKKDANDPGAALQWAFAGKSRSSQQRKNDSGDTVAWHCVWDHYIDSKSNGPVSDEGDMTLQEDGLVLEQGVNVDEATGKGQKYEELWHDLDIEAMEVKGNKSSIVVRTEQNDSGAKGLVVKVGGYCQGIVEKAGYLTVERWEQHGAAVGDEATGARNDWIRTFRLGKDALPCKDICERTEGKKGIQDIVRDEDGVEWRVIEEYYFWV